MVAFMRTRTNLPSLLSRRPSWTLGQALSLVALAGACSCDDERITPTTGGSGGSGGDDTSSSTGGGGGYAGPCTELTPGDTSIFFLSIAAAAVEAPVTPAVPDLAKSRLTLELYDYDFDTGMPLDPIVPGSYPFATPPDDNYGTCQHCVLLVGYDATGQPKRAFYPKNGTFALEAVGADFPPFIRGKIQQAELVEVTQNEDLTWEELPGGDCYYVDEWPFDTEAVDGGPCLGNEQCPNEAVQICEPGTAVCGPGQCDLFGDTVCDAGEVCLSQVFGPADAPFGPALGACYDECEPSVPGACGVGRFCRPLGLTQSFGICLDTGAGAIGEACTPRDISTECVDGAVCVGEPGECARVCDFLTPEAGCDADRYCSFANLCEPAAIGDAAAIGESCAPTSPETRPCGIEGDAFRGVCVRWFPEQVDTSCERLCRTAEPDCPGSEVCLAVFDIPTHGLCREPAVCGDDVLDLIGGEVCDDGNTVAGDGCAADCTAAELDALCLLAPPLPEATDVAGTTVGGPSGYASQCDPYVGTRVAIFAYDAPGPGRVNLTLTSDAELTLSAYADCTDPGTELGCQLDPAAGELALDLIEAPTEPLLVIVRGVSPLAEGAFTVRAEFVPAVCGDGVTVGPEACDDGNLQGGDGCSADCLAIEWTNVCSSLPTLSTTSANVGTTEGALNYFELGGVCSPGEEGVERAYTYVAPTDGTLELTLSQPDADLSIFIRDECGPIDFDTWLGCGNTMPAGAGSEVAIAELAQGQRVTVIVDGANAGEAGAFSLEATFTP
jgi:cysteine-rich repeat protein